MNYRKSRSCQSGLALILTLFLLFVMTLLAVAGFGNCNIQERSASNARLQTVALEAAAAGASESIEFFLENPEIAEDQLCGAAGHEGWSTPTDWVDRGTVGQANLRQRMYCLADAYPCEVDDVDCDVRPPRSQLFVLSRGEVLSGEQAVATRDVEVRITTGTMWAASGGCGALCFPYCDYDSLDFPSSNVFQIDGNGGPAVTTPCDTMTDEVRDAISNMRIGNYIGGIETSDAGSPFNNSAETEAFRSIVEAQAIADQASGACMTGCYFEGDQSDFGYSDYGTVDNPQITYVDGDASYGGNVSGAGIMLVTGNLSWTGTPDFKGLILVLGGTYIIDGGGVGGDHGGSIVVLNAPGDGSEFGPVSYLNREGGHAQYRYECTSLLAARGLLDSAGQTLWNVNCDDPPENLFEAGPSQLIIASWRENIGWREEIFLSEE